MKLRSWILVASLASCVLSMRAEAYPGGGVPNDSLSCYGKCGGKSPTSGTTKCYCDTVCNLRGDCCADRDEFCAPAVAKPACALTSATNGSDFCGTDLGFVYQHGNRMEILFGDTWEWPANTATKNPVVPEGQPMPEVGKPQPAGQVIECRDRGEGIVISEAASKSDDSQGRIPVSRPAGLPLRAKDAPPPGSYCGPSVLTLDMDPTRPSTFQAVTLRDKAGTELKLPPGSTPLAGFSDGTSAWGIFSKAKDAEGTDPHVYMGKRRGEGTALDRATYDVQVDLGENPRFLSPSVARITSYDGNAPNTGSNYATPTGTAPSVMLMFGRPKFGSTSLDSVDDNAMYLMMHTLPFTEWKPQYFNGLEDGTEKPLWTDTASLAKKVINDDFKVTDQIDIKWVPQLGKWIMLYGGDYEWYFIPPYPTDQPRHGAIHMRLADNPWGPWSRATPLLWREDMGRFIKCDAVLTAGCDPYPPFNPVASGCNFFSYTYDPGDFTAGRPCSDVSACRSDLPQPVQPNFGCASRHQHGELYAANLIPTWTYDANNTIDAATNMKTTTIYFTVSTWMPYQVLIAAADIKLPVNIFGKFKVQLRDLNKKMIVVDTASMTGTANTTPAGGNGKGGPTSWLVVPAGGTPNNRGPRIGDTVAFIGTDASGNSKYLARDGGHTIIFPVIQPTIPTSAQWKIESTDASTVGTPIVVGKTPFKLLSVSSGTRHLKSKVSEGLLRAYDGSGTEADWMFSWGCIGGDTCPARSVANP